MRSSNQFWEEFIAKLGSKIFGHGTKNRQRLAKLAQKSSGLQIEALEPRQMLAGTPTFLSDTTINVDENTAFVVDVGTSIDKTTEISRGVGVLNKGIDVSDGVSSGTGYFLHFTEDPGRFQLNNSNNAEEWAVVRFNGVSWQYNSNSSWSVFNPTGSDRLMASFDFANDAAGATALTTQDSVSNWHWSVGAADGDLDFHVNTWNGSHNDGEYSVSGTYYTVRGISIGQLNSGIDVDSSVASGTGYFMHFTNNSSRFSVDNPANSEQLVVVQFDGSHWQYNTGSSWENFAPDASDRLLASFDFGDDSAGIAKFDTSDLISHWTGEVGVTGGDLVYHINQFNGVANDGKYSVGGTFYNADGISIGAVNRGIDVLDSVSSGIGYILHVTKNSSRFSLNNVNNSEELVVVRHDGDTWQFNNNASWVDFMPDATDRLLAQFDFADDAAGVSTLHISDQVAKWTGVVGITGGNLGFRTNFWNGTTNGGEYAVLGTHYNVGEYGTTPNLGDKYSIGALNYGIAVDDFVSSGTGYILHFQENGGRFSSNNPNNAEKLFVVQWSGTDWQYNNNSSWVNFTPDSSDRLLASFDFANDAAGVTPLSMSDQVDEWTGAIGISGGDLEFRANRWNGSYGGGEYEVTGTHYFAGVSAGDLGIYGIDTDDTETSGIGYFLHFTENDSRFSARTNPNSSDQFVMVQFDGANWQYNTSSAWVNFTPERSDRLLASIDFANDAAGATPLSVGDQVADWTGEVGASGGDLNFYVNQWNGKHNDGEYQITGTHYFTGVSVGDVNSGLDVDDGISSGIGYFVHFTDDPSRFSGGNPNNADEFAVIQFNGSDWQFNTGSAWTTFTPVSSDRLMASFDFGNDAAGATPYTAGATVSNWSGAVGASSGDLSFHVNQWNGNSNDGEYQVTGTHYFVNGSLHSSVSYAVTGGADQSHFTIDSETGQLRFVNEPDFERPGDANADNIYDVTITATAEGGSSTAQTLAITVQDTSGVITSDPVSRRVFVEGTSGNDTISITEVNSNRFQVELNSQTPQEFDNYSYNHVFAFGNAGNDTLTNSDDLKSLLDGGSGDDTLTGGGRRDLLDGGSGSDTLKGNDGNDIYRFNDATAQENDSIEEGSGIDSLDFRSITTTVAADLDPSSGNVISQHAFRTLTFVGTNSNLENAFGLTDEDIWEFDGEGQTVAIIDSGIAYDHSALGGGFGTGFKVVGGYDFAESDTDPYDDGPDGIHGTHVAGIVSNTSTSFTGIAKETDLVALRVFDDNSNGDLDNVRDALSWVVDHKDDFASPITTINISLGIDENLNTVPDMQIFDEIEDLFSQLNELGVFISVSAGNSFQSDMTTGLQYPAISPHVVPVASHGNDAQANTLSSFSQRRSNVLVAPGEAIVSTIPDHVFNVSNVFAALSGTSQAAPYVAGGSALLREAYQGIGFANVNQDTIYSAFTDHSDSISDSVTNADYNKLNLEATLAAVFLDDYVSANSAMAAAASSIGQGTSTTSTTTLTQSTDFDSPTETSEVEDRNWNRIASNSRFAIQNASMASKIEAFGSELRQKRFKMAQSSQIATLTGNHQSFGEKDQWFAGTDARFFAEDSQDTDFEDAFKELEFETLEDLDFADHLA